jgi:hypothetical protein
MATFRTVTGAEYWASYLINGDASGLSIYEKAACDNWLSIELEPGETIVDCEDEGRFTWSYDLHTHTGIRGGNVLDYTVRKG